MLVVEDVHWASEPLLELLEKLTDALSDTAVLTICTARPEFFDTRGAWGGGVRDAASIRLAPLPETESLQLVEALVGVGGLPGELTRRIVARAEGNPFYVEEILQMLIDREAIARENGGWSVRARLDEVELPDSIHGVIAARVDLLDAASREALRRCSVMGRVFWPHAVGVDESVIASLGRRALVTEHPESTVAGMREFVFKHALTHDVAYSTLPRGERRDAAPPSRDLGRGRRTRSRVRDGRDRRVPLRSGARVRRDLGGGQGARVRALPRGRGRGARPCGGRLRATTVRTRAGARPRRQSAGSSRCWA